MCRTAKKGFTLVELLMALVVAGVILSSIAALAYAISSASAIGADVYDKQARVRVATLRISDLLRHSRLLCLKSDDSFAVWRSDDNGDGHINLQEIVYVATGSGRSKLKLVTFSSSSDTELGLSDISTLESGWWSGYGAGKNKIVLMYSCENVRFRFDSAPPQTRFVSILFELGEEGQMNEYQINSSVGAWAGHLLDAGGNLVSSDDDE